MENSETLSPSTRLAVVLVGALQGLICYGISEYIAYAKLPSDTVWSLCVMPATVVDWPPESPDSWYHLS